MRAALLRYRRSSPDGILRPQTMRQKAQEMLETRPYGPMRRCTTRSCATAFTIAAVCPSCDKRTLPIGHARRDADG